VNISVTDQTVIREQIGREPQGISAIAARAKNGVPVVLQMRSMVSAKPFPTLYWLCSKDLSKAIGSIETQGWVKTIEQRIEDDEILRNRFLGNQQQYVAKRLQEMTEEDQKTIEQRGFKEMFKRYGIGGISQWNKVRCLHMQYAHHLVDGNAVGEILDQEFELYKLLDKDNLK
jgi:hypothetical protein